MKEAEREIQVWWVFSSNNDDNDAYLLEHQDKSRMWWDSKTIKKTRDDIRTILAVALLFQDELDTWMSTVICERKQWKKDVQMRTREAHVNHNKKEHGIKGPLNENDDSWDKTPINWPKGVGMMQQKGDDNDAASLLLHKVIVLLGSLRVLFTKR